MSTNSPPEDTETSPLTGAEGSNPRPEQLPDNATSPPTVPLWSLPVPFVVALLLLLFASQQPDGRLHVWVLDVGQGDSILLKTPKGHVALIDGGPGATPVLNGVGAHIPFWQRQIDLLVLTHPHQDHMMGFVELLARYGVGQVVETQFTATMGVQAEWLGAVKEHHIPVHYARRGETISFEGEPDVALRVLSPVTPDAAREKAGGDINNTSIVLHLTYGKEGMLLEGDAQQAAEEEMVRREAGELSSQVLKVGHHGSDTSSSPRFLAGIQPQVAIISVGAGNRFGHPSPQTIEALRKVGARVYRTDLDGTIEVIAARDQLWVRSEKP
jgi:competence protein ComEC